MTDDCHPDLTCHFEQSTEVRQSGQEHGNIKPDCHSSLCELRNDFFAAAKDYCEKRGTHLATLGELKSLGYTEGTFWADGSEMNFVLDDGDAHRQDEGSGDEVVCVGN